MVFSSLFFLFGFFPIFLLLYFISPRWLRNIVALAGSFLFYAWGASQFVPVFLGATLLDYLLARSMVRFPAYKKTALIFSVVSSLGLLAYVKYANFFVGEWNGLFPDAFIALAPIALPIGISFITFHKISYVVDVYRGTVQPAKSYADFLLYMLLFPQLIAGPIVRYHDIEDQIRNASHRSEQLFEGFRRFIIGLAKKVLIANQVGFMADAAFSGSDISMAAAWVGLLAYTIQIYFDFSGYTDMALGIGRMMGFTLPENFHEPYKATSVTDFWRRWHISLTKFMREYVYIPLGGNRKGNARTYVNICIIFFLSGLWHGAAWTFIVWGLYYGILLCLERVSVVAKALERLPYVLQRVYALFLIMIGWVLFRAETLPKAWEYIVSLFSFTRPFSNLFFFGEMTTIRGLITLLIALAISLFTIRLPERWKKGLISQLTLSVTLLVLFALSMLSLASATFNPFIYFRF